ncbi:MAG TPA: hypothetical protein PKD59_08890 [Miltoncostaeaceae bacterium]|nr:hypothetical protein [Miltoncostaeaceae bacterium]
MDEEKPRNERDEEAPGPAPGGGGVGYTGRPSREEPEDGGATRDEDRERPDTPDGRERT